MFLFLEMVLNFVSIFKNGIYSVSIFRNGINFVYIFTHNKLIFITKYSNNFNFLISQKY